MTDTKGQFFVYLEIPIQFAIVLQCSINRALRFIAKGMILQRVLHEPNVLDFVRNEFHSMQKGPLV